jgi:XTP/dITP diphosphohydrolase
MIDLLIATRNSHKLEEIQQLAGTGIRCFGLAELPPIPEVEETALTFDGNAVLKARAIASCLCSSSGLQEVWKHIGRGQRLFVVADDSGLEVDALGGAPGVHSARYASISGESNASDQANNRKLLQALSGIPLNRRQARFRCVIAIIDITRFEISSDTDPPLFMGACEGQIAFHTKGDHGFGYDPLFLPEGFTQSLAELGSEVKQRISHRAVAVKRMVDFLHG